MNASLHRQVLWSLLLVFVSVGCASNAKPADGEAQATTVKPIDQVQQDILAVKQQLLAATAAAETRADDLPAKVAATDLAIANLRKTIAQLDQRSDDYMAMWSRQATVNVHTGGVHRTYTDVPQRTLNKYQQMLTALRAARDKVNPALSDLRKISESDASTNTAQLAARAREQAMLGIDQLDKALQHLEELKVMVRKT